MSAAGVALIVAVVALSLAAAVLWWVATASAMTRPGMRRAARAVTWAALAAAVGVCGLMLGALLVDPAAFAYSQRAIEPGMPTYYRITSLWAGLEGSLLLWVLCAGTVAALFGALPTRSSTASHGISAAVLNVSVAAFALIALGADPFAPAAGGELDRPSPLLQDHPAMGLHPPLLYVGFTALAVPYALAISAMITRSWDNGWARAMRTWTVVAWIPLTAGIGLGAWWSYAVLGWGGYWAWDPVENASLMPWLLATGLLHTVGPRARGAGWRGWALALGIGAYLLVLLATFLTRSGLVSSVHAFSVSSIGPLLLVLLAVAALVPLVIALMPGRLPPRAAPSALLSRQSALRVHRVGIVAITLIVLAGSVLPSVLLVTTGVRISVGAPWYERILAPVAFILLLVMAVAPSLRWRQDDPPAVLRRLRAPALTAAAVAAAAALAWSDAGLAACCGVAAFILTSTAVRLMRGALRGRAAIGGAIAHVGVVAAAVAIAGGSGANVSERTIAVGETVAVGDVSATLVDVTRVPEDRRVIESARMLLTDGDRLLGTVAPELRWYGEHDTVLAGPSIRSEPLRDIYITLLGVDAGGGGATVRLAVMPFVSWLWASSAVVIAGAVVAASPGSRRRVPTPPEPALAPGRSA